MALLFRQRLSVYVVPHCPDVITWNHEENENFIVY